MTKWSYYSSVTFLTTFGKTLLCLKDFLDSFNSSGESINDSKNSISLRRHPDIRLPTKDEWLLY